MTLQNILCVTFATLAGVANVVIGGYIPASAGGPERNLFAEYLGASEDELDAKLRVVWNRLFYGDDETERLYYPVGDDMAYIYAVDSDDVRSEGMSYGMMIAVQMDRQAEFDRLWKWAMTYMHHPEGERAGYFAWSCKRDGTVNDPGSASDGEEWFATALFFASGRWGDGEGIFNYREQANAILRAMLGKGEDASGEAHVVSMFNPVTKQVRFVPLAQWAEVTDPSYHMPFFYELWAEWADENNDFWHSAAGASRELFRKAAHPVTGLMPDYSRMDGTPFPSYGHEHFVGDAHRTLAYVALDWAWMGRDPWQKEQSNRVLSFLAPYRGHIPYSFTLDGQPRADYSSDSIVAMAAVAALAADREIGEPFVRDLWEHPVPSGQYRYYNGLLYMLGLLETGGRFTAYAPQGARDVMRSGEGRAAFTRFEYKGDDDCYRAPIAPGQHRNPILPGFRPDPSICRVGDQYYLVNSTFAYFPGVPVYRSTDLVHWEQLGHVLDRPSQLPLDGAGVSRGIFAPTISHHDGLFYMVTTNVSGPGNFYVTARDPVGPWSEPVALEGVDGIDPSFFFDEVTGRAWLVNNGPPPDNKPLYDGHRAIWIQEFDAASGRLVGPRSIIVNGGVDLAAKPVWVEGPHIFRRGEWLYLSCAEGGTSENHSQVIFRAKEATGPWEAWSGNPILTQRDLPADRPLPVTCTGHADYVDAGEAGWWAVFLGCRPYEGNNYITGRETFLLPVTWTEDGWPVILPRGEVVPYVAQAPALPKTDGECLPTGNFTWVDDFSDPWLRSDWQMLRTPRDCWWSLGERAGDDALLLRPKYVWLCSRAEQPAFLGYRVQHARCEINLDVAVPTDKVTDAGLGVFQGEGWFYFLGVRICPEKGVVAFLETMTGGTTRDFVWRECDAAPGSIVHLKALIDGATCRFSFSTDGVQWTQFAECDASILTTAKAGGFVGTMAGPHARLRWQ